MWGGQGRRVVEAFGSRLVYHQFVNGLVQFGAPARMLAWF
jgi:hypothetical protein